MHLYYIYVGWQQFFYVDKLFSPDPYCFHSVGTYYVFRFTVYTLCLHTYVACKIPKYKIHSTLRSMYMH